MENNQATSIVVGGGITGLTAAYKLIKNGHQVRLVESGVLGGLIRTSKQDGFTLERGPNVLLSKPDIMKLIEDLSLTNDVVYPKSLSYKQMVWYRGSVQVVPKGPLQFFRSNLIPFRQKPIVIRNLFKNGIGRNIPSEASVYQFISAIFGDDLTRNIVDPALKGIYGGDITKLRAASIFPELFAALKDGKSIFSYLKQRKASATARPKAFVLRGGAISLIKALQAFVISKGEILNEKVSKISRACSGSGYQVTLSQGEILHANNIYITTSGSVSAPLVRDLSQQLYDNLLTLDVAPIVVVHLATDQKSEIPINSFGVLFPSDLKSPFLGVMFNSELFPHTAPAGKHLLTVCLGGRDYPSVLEMREEELVRLAKEVLSEKLNIKNTYFLSITKWPRAIPQFEIGHGQIVKNMKECEKNNPGVYFIGSDCGGIGVPDRVKMAMSI